MKKTLNLIRIFLKKIKHTIALLLSFIIGVFIFWKTGNLSDTLAGSFLILFILITLFFRKKRRKKLFEFLEDVSLEMRKINWPSLQETLQTTFIILMIVIFSSFTFWMIDKILVYTISSIITLRI
ncbi:preprotein translocase subunit SecE [Candidatus Riesia pediculicola]|uniref:preprotein translocase subunit SecE n=1 Tax=Candidatus Riesia pediculicola TaxID=401619 RepID=UPI003B968142